jgi:hypothetical protein
MKSPLLHNERKIALPRERSQARLETASCIPDVARTSLSGSPLLGVKEPISGSYPTQNNELHLCITAAGIHTMQYIYILYICKVPGPTSGSKLV